jgi:hypothetical protein
MVAGWGLMLVCSGPAQTCQGPGVQGDADVYGETRERCGGYGE